MRKSILLIKHFNFSNADKGILNQLNKQFPEFDIEVFDIKTVYKEIRYKWFFINVLFFIYEYGMDFILGYKKISSGLMYFKNTSLIAEIFRRKLKNYIEKNPAKYAFTFQLQSLFNGNSFLVPHFVYTDHVTLANDTYPDINPREYKRSNLFLKIEKNLYSKSTMCFTMSSNISQLLIHTYNIPVNKVKCVFAGGNIDIPYDNEGNTYSSKNILFIGIDWKRKGGPFLLSVFKEVQKKIPDVKLTIIGCSPKIKIANVHVLGRLNPSELGIHFKNATLFCLPTLREPFGLVFIEAMRYKLPIISNKIGALPDMVINGLNGYLLNYNLNDYVEIMTKLLLNPSLCKQLGENGYLHATKQYDWDKVGQELRKNIAPYI